MPKTKQFDFLRDRTPKYTVKEVADMMELSPYTVRYYDNIGLIPFVDRTDGNIRLFSDYNVSWLKLVHCLRSTGLSIEGVKSYIDMCKIGDSTIAQRAELIFNQEKILRDRLKNLRKQMQVLKYKKDYYKKILASGEGDRCNPKNFAARLTEPEIAPQERKLV